MRRLLRWTFHALAAASLLLCLATAGLWVRSYWVYDQFVAAAPERGGITIGTMVPAYYDFAGSYRGRFAVWFGWSERPRTGPTPRWEITVDHPSRPASAAVLADLGFSADAELRRRTR